MGNKLEDLTRRYKKKSSALLFFSGGLDTSFLCHFFSKKLGWKIYTLFVDLGADKNEINRIKRLAYSLGSVGHYIIDAKDRFVSRYISYAILANARFYGMHPLCSSLSRPLISTIAAKLAENYKIPCLMHGSNKFQNNEARYERALKILTNKKIIAPIKDTEIEREIMLNYLNENEIRLNKISIFSSDENLWGREIEDYKLSDPSWIPNESIYQKSHSLNNVPKETFKITIGFKFGLPVEINYRQMPLITIIQYLNAIGEKYRIGRFDCMEDRILGHKEREIHESPAAHIIILAHKDLEISILPKKTLLKKSILDLKWTYLVFQGFWYNKKKVALDKEIAEINKPINGSVILKFYASNCDIVGRKSNNIMTKEKFLGK